jgi:hypothetical protein
MPHININIDIFAKLPYIALKVCDFILLKDSRGKNNLFILTSLSVEI